MIRPLRTFRAGPLTGTTGFNGAWAGRRLVEQRARVTGKPLAHKPGQGVHDLLCAGRELSPDLRAGLAHPDAKVWVDPSGDAIVLRVAAQATLSEGVCDPVRGCSSNPTRTKTVLQALRCPCAAALTVASDKVYRAPGPGRPGTAGLSPALRNPGATRAFQHALDAGVDHPIPVDDRLTGLTQEALKRGPVGAKMSICDLLRLSQEVTGRALRAEAPAKTLLPAAPKLAVDSGLARSGTAPGAERLSVARAGFARDRGGLERRPPAWKFRQGRHPMPRDRAFGRRENLDRWTPDGGVPHGAAWMQLAHTHIPGVLEVEGLAQIDARGGTRHGCWAEGLVAIGLDFPSAQASLSTNLRGLLHRRAEPHRGAKPLRCVAGAIWDVTVDLRAESLAFRCRHRLWRHACRDGSALDTGRPARPAAISKRDRNRPDLPHA
ncbi:dTDP-4-dehydrorhamnose 3,5-epimerase family protein [Roseicyclus mahoneyensis]|uniref:dTDP-4-dehydrorhamnose 3,5-epimerase n=1 Tax=Roseicyclus mahoneyensis TaxID=164332 RepID=A0A316GF80_9RHOB|nr:dTDP-4-dehydrorhamnose 3,5-epimerase family protein [Roseicyclus mahoneyensis]PWK59606.1 dTDP-4-dehydrorhamnose 3,5-epimerase [Roseicyclus mahoneyensis]